MRRKRNLREIPPAVRISLLTAAGLLVGNGLAALPSTGNDLCTSAAGNRPVRGGAEGVTADGGMELWPLQTWCAYDPFGGESFTVRETIGPSIAAWVLWLVLGVALALTAHRYRGLPPVRGAACGAAVLAVFALAQHFAGEYPGAVLLTVVFAGTPLAAAIDHALRPRRRLLASVVVGAVMPTSVIVAWTVPAFMDLPTLGTVLGIATGAVVAAAVGRVGALERPPLASPAPG